MRPAEFAMLRSPASDPVAAANRFDLCPRSRMLRALGVGKVGRKLERLRHELAGAKPRGRRRDVRGRKAEAMHPAVDFQPDAEDMRAIPGFEERELPVLVHEGLERVARGSLEFLGIADALEQDDARGASRLAERNRFFDPGDGECIGRRKRFRDRNESMAVGIRLDDREHPAAGSEFADPRKIVPERRRVDDSAQRSAQNAPSP